MREPPAPFWKAHGIDYHEMEKWYDGYLLSGTHIYNPKSVADALTLLVHLGYLTYDKKNGEAFIPNQEDVHQCVIEKYTKE